MRYLKGSITIYFAFSIILIISVILSVTELARYNCQKLYLQIATDSGIDSMLSLYHRKLYDYYNLYGVEYRTDEMLTEEYLSYIKPYFIDLETGRRIGNWYDAKIDKENIDLIHKQLIDNTYFEKEILEYMRYALIGKTIDFFGKEVDIKSKDDLIKLLDSAKEVYSETVKSKVFSEVHKRYFNFSGDIKTLEKYGSKIEKYIDDTNSDIQSLKNLSTGGTASSCKSVVTKIEKVINQIEKLLENLDAFKGKMDNLREIIINRQNEYFDDKNSGRYEFTDEICEFIESEFDEFLAMVSEDCQMMSEVNNKKAEANEIIEVFNQINEEAHIHLENIEEIEEEIKEAGRATGEDRDTDYIKELRQEKRDLEKDFSDYLKEVKKDIKDIVISDIQLDLTTNSHQSEENDINKLIGFDDSVLLNLVLSQEDINRISGESIYCNSYSMMTNAPQISIDKILLSEYSLDKFNYFNKDKNNETTKSNSTSLEVERLIGGKNKDIENIKEVIKEIFVYRLAMNVLYIYKNPEMRQEARIFTRALFLGFSQLLAEIMFLVVITAWGAAQSIVDIKRILKNHKVNFMHNSSSWSMSIENILDIVRQGVSGIEERDDDEVAINYKDYLRLILIFHDQSEIDSRMIGIIEQNLIKEQESFDIKKMIYSFEVNNKFYCRHFFTNFIFVGAKDVVLDDEYYIRTKSYKAFTQ